MKGPPSLLVMFALAIAACGSVYLLFSAGNATQDREQRRYLFQEAATRAEPLIAAIEAYTTSVGNPPDSLDEIVPQFLTRIPATGLRKCDRFEYRSLTQKSASIVWYDLGSRRGQSYTGQSRFDAGDPEHAILVFTLDTNEKITGALIDRLPKGRDPEDFDTKRWKSGENRIEMALSLSDTYRLHGMPRDVLVSLLGPPDGSRTIHGAPWELRINCPTGLLNHDTLVYWPTEKYPEHLYGGNTEAVGRWVYVRSD
jgi:hypothetical protein